MIRFGSNTPCIEVRNLSSGALLVLDAGTGIVGLGDELDRVPRLVPIILTHYHWDHVQGLPLFLPLFKPDCEVSVWGPTFPAGDVNSIHRVFQAPSFSPRSNDLRPPAVHAIGPGTHDVAGFDVGAQPLTHPGGALAYCIRGDSGNFVYATDHEFGTAAADEALAWFARGASALVLDAHFTPEEAPAAKGWGHSTWQQAAQFAVETGVERLWLFHHKPGRSDHELEQLVLSARAIFPSTEAAGEGKAFEF
jgi:ribonuclease BN (tRNA processing enzyme)